MMTGMLGRLALVALLAGCGGTGTGPDGTDGGGDDGGNGPPPEPDVATVVVVNGALARAGSAQTATLHLRNDGPAGTFRLEFWGRPETAGGPDTFMGSTEPVEVDASYDEEASYNLNPDVTAAFVVVFTRDDGSTKFLQTDRFDFP